MGIDSASQINDNSLTANTGRLKKRVRMTKDVLLTRVAAIISALGETGGSPESMLYIFCEMDMQAWELVRDILLRSRNIEIKGHYVTLTPFGRETAKAIDAAMANKGGR